MKYTINDIKEAAKFAVSLKNACKAMLDGKPKSQALVSNGISLTTYDTLIKGLRRDSGETVRKLAYNKIKNIESMYGVKYREIA